MVNSTCWRGLHSSVNHLDCERIGPIWGKSTDSMMQSGTPYHSQSKLSLNWLLDEAERQMRLRKQRGKMGSWNPQLLSSVGLSSFLFYQRIGLCGRSLCSNLYSELPEGEYDPDLGLQTGFNMRRVGEAEKWEAGLETAELALEKNWTYVLQRSSGNMSFRGQVEIKQSLGKRDRG